MATACWINQAQKKAQLKKKLPAVAIGVSTAVAIILAKMLRSHSSEG